MLSPAAGGPGVAELEDTLRRATARWRVVSASLTTWALDRDPDGVTEKAVQWVFRAAVGDA
jgi:hypothetical protein